MIHWSEHEGIWCRYDSVETRLHVDRDSGLTTEELDDLIRVLRRAQAARRKYDAANTPKRDPHRRRGRPIVKRPRTPGMLVPDLPIGTLCSVKLRDGTSIYARTRSSPWRYQDGTWVVLVDGSNEDVEVSTLRVIPEGDPL